MKGLVIFRGYDSTLDPHSEGIENEKDCACNQTPLGLESVLCADQFDHPSHLCYFALCPQPAEGLICMGNPCTRPSGQQYPANQCSRWHRSGTGESDWTWHAICGR